MSWACLLRTYTSWHEKCEAYSDAVLDLFGPYLYDLLQDPLTVFKKALGLYHLHLYKMVQNWTLQTSTPRIGLICSSCCLRALYLARGLNFHVRPSPGNECHTMYVCIYIYITLYNYTTIYNYIYTYIHTYLRHPPVLKFGLLAKSIKIQPLKIKNSPGSLLEQEKCPWKIIPESCPSSLIPSCDSNATTVGYCWCPLLAPNQQLKSLHDMPVWDEQVARLVWKRTKLLKTRKPMGATVPVSKKSEPDRSI